MLNLFVGKPSQEKGKIEREVQGILVKGMEWVTGKKYEEKKTEEKKGLK